jgi:Cu+-exporting ATPase
MLAEQATNEKVETAGRNASSLVTELAITGMTCSNCARHVTEAIQSVAGVRSAAVRLEANEASVRWAAEADPDVPAVLRAIQEAGYDAAPSAAPSPEDGEQKVAGWQINLWLGILCTVPLMIGEWLLGLGTARWFQWASFFLAGIVQLFAGTPFYRGAWRQLKAGRSNMDTLVALGSTTAFAYSTWALLRRVGGHVYFMEAAAIITLISVGHWIESRVSLRASSALRQLLNLAPARARRLGRDGTEAEVPVAELRSGDLVALRPGDHVPTDGEVVEGHSALDESMLTGESVPVDKSPGDRLYAGTANVTGRLTMNVTATGEETALAHIIDSVQRAQSSRADIQRLGDRVSNVFVPLVVLVAAAAGLWWGLAPEHAHQAHLWLARFLWPAHPPYGSPAAAFIIAAAVLIIACPCAMGLATPAAIMAGSNAAARRGILIRDGIALEKAGEVTAVLFDKTGTLTAGKPEVIKTWLPSETVGDPSASPMLMLAAAVAKHSSHPISQAVARVATPGGEVVDWEEVRGSGVQGRVEIRSKPEAPISGTQSREWYAPGLVSVRLGSLRWLEAAGVDLGPGKAFISEWAAQGATVVGLAADKSLEGLFAVRDVIKSGAPKVTAQLQRRGFQIYLVTGDNSLTAATIARQVGISPEKVFAEVRPEQKAEFVERLQRQGERVAFVGDGINDAPALEQADLGVAVSRASDVAREAADIILLNSEIEAVPEALGLARATLRTIKQNLFWAFFYNAVGVPLAALGFMSPILCAAAMGLSDLVVIGNALRLRSWRS